MEDNKRDSDKNGETYQKEGHGKHPSEYLA
jgi:hypothetical protein